MAKEGVVGFEIVLLFAASEKRGFVSGAG